MLEDLLKATELRGMTLEEVCRSYPEQVAKTIRSLRNNLTQEDTAFILWCLGYVYGLSDTLDEAHKKYINEHNNIVLPKIAKLHESLNKEHNNIVLPIAKNL
jgi:hypothetical protein